MQIKSIIETDTETLTCTLIGSLNTQAKLFFFKYEYNILCNDLEKKVKTLLADSNRMN